MKRKNKYLYLWVIQGDYGYGWDDLSQYDFKNGKEMLYDFTAYRQNEPEYNHRFIQRRELND